MPGADAKAEPVRPPGAPERYRLPAEARESLKELRALSEKAEGGGAEGAKARKELRRKLREASPEEVARASDVGRQSQRRLVETASGGNPLTEEALSVRLDMMREEIAGEDPTPLEVLLTERVVSLWMLTALLEALVAGQYRTEVGDASERPSPAYVIQQSRILESATRRYLAAVRELARVRRLQAGAPRPGP